MAGRFLWGTSGYSYDHWREVFYPKGMKTGDRLAYYAEHFPAVELNVTHYRLPDRDVFSSWRAQTPDDFRFVLKGSRLITHFKRLLDPKDAVREFFDHASGLRDKLECVLWQLPPKMPADAGRLDAFCEVVGHVSPVRQAFEFRNDTWFAEEVYDVLRRHGCALCVAHSPERKPREVLTAPFTYLRFHGGEKMYDSDYTDQELARWARLARRWLKAGTDVYAFFNNDPHGYAVEDARGLAALVQGTKMRKSHSPDSSGPRPAPRSGRS
jgi:uncharacterized protein YecE (DUF72 family)